METLVRCLLNWNKWPWSAYLITKRDICITPSSSTRSREHSGRGIRKMVRTKPEIRENQKNQNKHKQTNNNNKNHECALGRMGLLHSWTHRTGDCTHKTCTRGSQSLLQYRWGRAQEAPPQGRSCCCWQLRASWGKENSLALRIWSLVGFPCSTDDLQLYTDGQPCGLSGHRSWLSN